MSRNLAKTLYTFEKYVFNELDRGNITYDVFWSSMAAVEEIKTRNVSDSYGSNNNPYDISLLNPCQFSIANQELVRYNEFHTFLKSFNVDPSDQSQDRYKDNFASIQNVLCAYHSQHTLAEMITVHEQIHNFTYDAVVALRPDTALMRPLDLAKNLHRIQSNAQRTLWVPDFHHWDGLNDRFAYGSSEVMSIYLKRGRAYRNGKYKSPHIVTEELVKKIVEDYQLKVEFTSMRLLRVRANGFVADPFRRMNLCSNGNGWLSEKEYKRCVDEKGHRIVT